MNVGVIMAIALIALICYNFLRDTKITKNDFQDISIEKRFESLIGTLNQVAFKNKAIITKKSNTELVLYETGANQIIEFTYTTGTLIIKWSYKYFQKEIVHKKRIPDALKFDNQQQFTIAEFLSTEMLELIGKHQMTTLNEINNFK